MFSCQSWKISDMEAHGVVTTQSQQLDLLPGILPFAVASPSAGGSIVANKRSPKILRIAAPCCVLLTEPLVAFDFTACLRSLQPYLP